MTTKIFNNGKSIKTDELRKGLRTVDIHVFIDNTMLEHLTEVQLNLENKTDKKIKRSRLINLFVMESLNNLKGLSDEDKIKHINNLSSEYDEQFND